MSNAVDTFDGAAGAADNAAFEVHDVEAVNRREKNPLYKARVKVYPKRAHGRFRTLKWWILAITLGIYYVTPWIRWDRGEYAPDQAVLVDLAGRRFFFFWIQIWPHEFFYVAGMLVMAGIGLFLVTSTVGRAWCGYTCPQTVWVDLFLVVERFFEGDRNERIRRDKAPFERGTLVRKIAKHGTWLLIAVATGGAWVFYFADAPQLLTDLFTGNAPASAYISVAILTFTTYVFGGLMREQVCTYMCPWPRIQAAMLDENSLIVTYNDWRGEPRSRHMKRERAAGKPIGDCVDCNACVAVCPMGIDIRDGQQLECITCALCIDACDSVMDKLGLERGLVAYSTLKDYNTNMMLAGGEPLTAGAPENRNAGIDPTRVRDASGRLAAGVAHTGPRSFIRPRTVLYAAIYCAIGVALLVTLFSRDRLDASVIPDRNPLYVMLSDGSIRNGYELKIRNMVPEPRRFRVAIEGFPGAEMKLVEADDYQGNSAIVEVGPDQLRSVRLFVRQSRDRIGEQTTHFQFVTEEIDGPERTVTNAQFEAPATGP